MVYVSDKKGVTDGVMYGLCERINSPVPIVLVAWSHNFKFNPTLLELKDVILVDACEYGYDHKFTDTHLWGINSEKFPRYYTNDWVKFDNWVKEANPKLLLKRELLKKDVSDKIIPIDYPCFYVAQDIETKEQFNRRPISSFFYWGRSHEARLKLHSNIWKAASDKGFSVCDNLSYFENFVMKEDGDKWVTLNIPHYGRVDIREILGRQQFSKTSISLPGAGVKTFRHVESSVNSVMVKWKDDMSWTYSWDESNCILTEEGKEIEDIYRALEDENLYEKYRAGVANCERYQINNYIQHLEGLIRERI